MLKEELLNDFLAFGLKPSSAKSYSNIIYTIIKKMNINQDELKNPVEKWFSLDEFNKKFKGLKHSTLRNYLSGLIALMKVRGETETELYKKLSVDVVENNAFYIRLATSGSLSSLEKKMWVEPEKISEMYIKNIRPILAGFPLYTFSKKKPASHKEVQPSTLKDVQDAVISSIYFYPFSEVGKTPEFGILRNDAATLHFYNQGRKKSILKDLDNSKNYFVQAQSSGSIILNDYKTAKKHGQQVSPLPDELFLILKAWSAFLELKNNEPLFNGVSKIDITSILQKITKRYLDKPISSQMLRKIFLTSVFGESKKEEEKLASSMGHTTEMQQNLYTKDV